MQPMANGTKGNTGVRHESSSSSARESNPPQVAHTLTACTRCRQRKTRCDPSLPRCGPCERTGSVCEYYDSSKGHNMPRSYVVWLQQEVQKLEDELERTANEDAGEDAETMMRAAAVRVHDKKDSETKYLGPSSGIAITRIVMQLAKSTMDARSIMDIVPDQRARQIKELFHQEEAKPTSKVYPLISDVAAQELPQRHLAEALIKLYKLKVQPMYPALHEPSLDKDVEAVYDAEAVYDGSRAASPYQNFLLRMVLAISLQKMDTQYAGLADSYYLAALKYLEPVVRRNDLKTLQCFALMAQYSLLTPTRTAIYYVMGIAMRLVQALGFNEEKTITRGCTEGRANFLEIDMRRRVFWCILVMDLGLAHSLGRPAMLATSHEHIDVGWFETCDDQYIKPEGIDPLAPRPELKKWIAIHFFKMRILQLEIRRKLYMRRTLEPKDDNDPWFKEMDAKCAAWRDASPNKDEGIGLDKKWFNARYNTMVVFLYRPSPQLPRPTLQAALRCYEAVEYNIYIQREQIAKANVDVTWIFTQTIFMAINTMLWTLSYMEVRRKYSRAQVEQHLKVAMDAIQLASDRWPGVASAVQLYSNLIQAVLKIYEKDGDVPVSATTPSDMASTPQNLSEAHNRSQTTSPATVSSASVATPEDRPPFGYLQQQASRSAGQPPQTDASAISTHQTNSPPAHISLPPVPLQTHQTSTGSMPTPQTLPQHMPAQQQQQQDQRQQAFDPAMFTNPLPQWTPDLTIPQWSAPPLPQHLYQTTSQDGSLPMTQAQMYNNATSFTNPVFDPLSAVYPFPGQQDLSNGVSGSEQWMDQYFSMDTGVFGSGINLEQQQELMHNLETDGMEDIQQMITQTLSSMAPKQNQQQPKY